MTTHHDRTGQTEMRECGRGPCWLGDGHDGPCRPGGRPHPDEEAERTVDPTGESAEDAAVRWMIRAKEEQRRALKAEQERDEARDHLRQAMIELRALDGRAAQPRPLTADDITDEMVGRALTAYDKEAGSRPRWDRMRHAITAALTEPSRPEGAEEWETWLSRLDYLHDETGASRADLATLANDLAERGVRVITEEER